MAEMKESIMRNDTLRHNHDDHDHRSFSGRKAKTKYTRLACFEHCENNEEQTEDAT